MLLSITSSEVTPEQAEQVEAFLQRFLPRLKNEQPGVVAIYHYAKPDKAEETTIMVWENEEALKAYREGDLIHEAINLERSLGLKSTREAYPLNLALVR